MNNIVGLGANVYYTQYMVAFYPKEGTNMPAKHAIVEGAGSCMTGLVTAVKLGASAAFIGNLADDTGGQFLKTDMERFGVSTEYVEITRGGASFSSCMWLSETSSECTGVFYQGNLPPLKLTREHKEAIAEAKIFMVDGYDLPAAIEGAKVAHKNGTLVLYHAEDLYDGVEKLLSYADILILSEQFALTFTGKSNACQAALTLFRTFSPKRVVVTQGKRGGILYEGTEFRAYPAVPVKTVDLYGVGDVFCGAFAYGLLRGFESYRCCLFASAVAALKCTKRGARTGIPSCEEVVRYLKKLGYDGFEKDIK